jgi:hypothetical protein
MCGAQGEPDPPYNKGSPVKLRERVLASLSRRLSWLIPPLREPAYPTVLPQDVAPYWMAGLFMKEGALPLDATCSAYADDSLLQPKS